MSTRQLPQPKAQWLASDGSFLSGGKVYTYEPGTTADKPTWRDAQKAVANTNPVILDSRGEAVIYWDGEYKVRVTDANDTLIYEQDNYGSGEPEQATYGAALNQNPGFERDTDGDGEPDGWTIIPLGSNTVALDTSLGNVDSGAAALEFTTTDGNKAGSATSVPVPVHAGETIYLSARAKTSNTSLKQSISIDWYTGSQTLINGDLVLNDAALTTNYTDVVGHAVAPDLAKFAAVRIEGPDGGGTELGSSWFDGCRIERKAANGINDASVNNEGYLKLSNGLILQWGKKTLTIPSGNDLASAFAGITAQFSGDPFAIFTSAESGQYNASGLWQIDDVALNVKNISGNESSDKDTQINWLVIAQE